MCKLTEVEYLEEADCDKEDRLTYRPPLDPGVCRLGRVAVDAFADDQVLLLVFDLFHQRDQFPDVSLQRILVFGIVRRYVHDAVHVE